MPTQFKGVRTHHKDYDKYLPKWQRCRDVMAGQDAVHDAGEKYLPKLNEQTAEDYKAYLLRTGFYNASWRTIAGLNGMLFRKAAEIDLPPALDDIVKDVTLDGVELEAFAKGCGYEVLGLGRIGLFVDYPTAPETGEVTVAEVQKLGLRPYVKMYVAETIINWKFKSINNKRMPCLVVLEEETELPGKDEFSNECEKRYRVLDLTDANVYRQRVFKVDDKGNDILLSEVVPLMNGNAMNFIPFVFDGPDGTQADCEDPPLLDLFDVNLSHYRSNADYEHGCHFTGLPTPWAAGFTQQIDANGKTEKLYIGSQTAWVSTDPNATCGYLEFTGQGLGALENILDRKEKQMAVLGARMLADEKNGVEAFKTVAVRNVAETSILASIAISMSKGIRTALEWLAMWSGVTEPEIEYEINREFLPVAIDAQTLNAYMAMWQSGGLSQGEFFELLQRADLIAAEKTLEEHQAEIDNAPPPAPPSNTQSGQLGTKTDDEKIALDKQKADAVPKQVMKGN